MRLDIAGVSAIAGGETLAGDGPPPVPVTIGSVAAVLSGRAASAVDIPTGTELAATG